MKLISKTSQTTKNTTIMEHSKLKLLNDAMYALGYDMSERKDLVTLKEELNMISQTVDKMLSLTEKEYINVVKEFDDIEYSHMYPDGN